MTARTALALYPFLGSDVARIMKSAAIRLRGSSALPFLAAVRRNAERVASRPRPAREGRDQPHLRGARRCRGHGGLGPVLPQEPARLLRPHLPEAPGGPGAGCGRREA